MKRLRGGTRTPRFAIPNRTSICPNGSFLKRPMAVLGIGDLWAGYESLVRTIMEEIGS